MSIKFVGKDLPIERVLTGFWSFDNACINNRGERGFAVPAFVELYADEGIGKCLGKGTKIFMWNKTLKNVEDIRPGDYLMGVDSLPRKVLSVTSGTEMMYWIRQTYGIDYRVNESHVLALKFSERNHRKTPYRDDLHISVRDAKEFLTETKLDQWKGYKVPVEFNYEALPIDPYFIGLWLGDGNSGDVGITSIDKEVIDYLYEYAERCSLQVTETTQEERCTVYRITKGYKSGKNDNSLQSFMRTLNLINNKHIPNKYLFSPREDRLRLLAGLIDSDGHRYLQCSYSITQKRKTLIEQIKLLCDTLGLRTSKTIREKVVNGETYYRITFSGDALYDVPILIERKKPTYPEKDYKINYDMSRISIEPDCIDRYYGFTLEGDGLFLLEDMTVTHNTTLATTLAGIIAEKLNGNIGIVDWEIQDMTTLMDILSRQGFSGEFERILEKSDEDTMDKFYDLLEREKTAVCILDSIAAFVSMSEGEGKQKDANMGKRGWNMAKFSRRTIRNLQLRKSPAVVLATNHIYPTMGGFVAGHDTAGGRAKKYAATYRFLLKKAFWKKKNRTELIPKIQGERPIGWVIEGRVEKARMGYSLTNFYMAMIMGEGISKNLTAMYECLFFEQADLDRNIVKLKVGEDEYQELGHITEFIKDRDNDKKFDPFKNSLASMTDTPTNDKEDEDE